MIEQTANTVESIARAGVAVLALVVNGAVIWYFYGKEIKAWWNQYIANWFKRQWSDYWSSKWEIDAHGTAADG